MRISERHFELPVIHQCRSNFRKFLCLRNFPRCCHVGLCNKYGDTNGTSSEDSGVQPFSPINV